nr:unnamed protein product [Callosobruchus analis]
MNLENITANALRDIWHCLEDVNVLI